MKMKFGMGLLTAWALVLCVAAPAAAQSNSLFRTGPAASAAPTTQPAGGAGETPLSAPPSLVYPRLGKDDEAPPPNEKLLAVSLIAVEAPRPHKIKVNDLITVIIREEKKSSSDSELKRDKKWEIDAELKKWMRITGDKKLAPQDFTKGNPALGMNYDDKYEGKGQVGREDSLVTRITAKVVDVKPNGLLVLQANKDIAIDEDKQVAVLTGACRSEDVTADNTVLSTQLANAHIDIQHSGPARDAARRGWLAQAWDFLKPL
jgi:flagellar L-ring protein FlgH